MRVIQTLLENPVIPLAVGLIALGIAIWLGYYKHPYAYRRFWKKVVNTGHKAHQLGLILLALVAVTAFIIVGVMFYYPNAVTAVQNSAPELYAWVEQYLRVVQVGFLGLACVVTILKAVGHYGDRLDDGIINDIDAERAINSLDSRIKTLETINSNLIDNVLELSKALHTNGRRFEKNPVPPPGIPERRKVVKADPSIPPTQEEVLARVALVLAPVEEEAPIETEATEEVIEEVREEEVILEPKKEVPVVPDLPQDEYNKIDKFFAKCAKWVIHRK